MTDPRAAAANSRDAERLITQLRELDRLLGEEYAAIRKRDTGQLEALTQEKEALVIEIDNTVARMGDGLNALIGKSARPSPAGITVRKLIASCQRANKTNGGALETSQSFTNSLLDLLRGQTPGQRTYTADGRLGAGSSSSAVVRI